ncbi:MAG: hypothetical protein NZ748_08505 [Candidatus Marinimicrobia bacterium]|nr:hypothetical protein [Candidatus Neomarinimicrobiota bacterium]
MLYDDVSVKDVVDSESALEFMKEATKLATSAELENIGQKLEDKSNLFNSILNPEDIATMSEDDFKKVVGKIFSIRRKSKRLLKANGFENLRNKMDALLYGDDPIENRFNQFVDSIENIEEKMRINFASELLHFTHPKKYWLWTNWIWDPDANTGALPLVVQEDVDLLSETNGGIYRKVGEAIIFVNVVGHAKSFSSMGRGLFGTDVLLACVYAVYMYTVFKVKLSQEFNRILPELPELTQRVLGVHNLEKN